jgi:hypothetical protein
MSTEFAALVAKKWGAQQPLRFLAADFFLPYWQYFLPGELDAASVRTTQEAARACVELAMGDETNYWEIDLSEENALRTWRLFDERTKVLPPEQLEHVRAMCWKLLATSEDSVSADELLSLITRLRNDWSFRGSLGYPSADVDILDAACERPRGGFLSMHDITEGWLASRTPWDARLRSHTPDLKESVAMIFAIAYGPNAALPLLRQNLRAVLKDESAYRAFVKRLEQAFDRAQSPQVKVKFPAVLLA